MESIAKGKMGKNRTYGVAAMESIAQNKIPAMESIAYIDI